ncbi:MAG: aminodeoxychorismate/anthranilate synthase component II [Bacteroidota bacterium]
MKLLVLDNYDSFTYNLVFMLREAGIEPDILRNNKISLEKALEYDAVLISPGPGIPETAGITKALISAFPAEKPLLGICLGHQAIAEVYGADLYNLPKVYHGLSIPVHINNADPIFKGLDSGFKAGRYHSWAVEPGSVKSPLESLAFDAEGNLMALRVSNRPHYGLQFHPESILTEGGKLMIDNWLAMIQS